MRPAHSRALVRVNHHTNSRLYAIFMMASWFWIATTCGTGYHCRKFWAENAILGPESGVENAAKLRTPKYTIGIPGLNSGVFMGKSAVKSR